MDKKLLLEKYIKVAVRKALKEQEAAQKKAEKSMYLIYRFPGLKKVMIELMSPAFGRYISGVDIVAPKPTTFKIGLINGQDFSIYYLGKGKFMTKISGKKYSPNNLGELERASQAVADLLELNYAPKEEAAAPAATDSSSSSSSSGGGGSEAPSPEELAKGDELAADLAAAEELPAETPAPEEEEIPAEA